MREAREIKRRWNRHEQRRAHDEAKRSVSGRQQVSRHRDPRNHHDQVGEAPPLEGHGEGPAGQQMHDEEHHQVCAAQGDPRAGDAERGDE